MVYKLDNWPQYIQGLNLRCQNKTCGKNFISHHYIYFKFLPLQDRPKDWFSLGQGPAMRTSVLPTSRKDSIMEKQGQKKMSPYVSSTVTRASVRQELHKKIFEFVNDMGFPTRTVEKEAFRSLLQFTINNANLLKALDCSISNRNSY